MPGYLSDSSAQKIRRFMESLGFAAPLNATSAELVDLLIERVRERRQDRTTRVNFQTWLAELSLAPASTPENLPTPECESIDPTALAEELGWLLEERPAAIMQTDGSRTIAPLLAAAILLISIMLGAGCQGDDDQENDKGHSPNLHDNSSNTPAALVGDLCSADLSTDHFGDMLGQSGDLSPDQIQEAIDEYQDLSKGDRQDVISDLCKMSPEDIAAYIESLFPNLPDDDTPTPDDDTPAPDDDTFTPDDDSVVYKGVSF